MATATNGTPSTVQAAHPSASFDIRRSAKADESTIRIADSQPHFRTRIPPSHKRCLERHLPTFTAGRAGR